MVSVSGIICECGDDDNVLVVKFYLFDCVECLCESECCVGCESKVRVGFMEEIQRGSNLHGGNINEVAVME